MPTRCKVSCSQTGEVLASIRQEDGKYKQGKAFNAIFFPVYAGSKENEAFFASTPSGKVELNMIAQKFEVGKEYYLDITEA